MSPASLALVLAAAGLHAAANTLIKRARDKLAFAWWMLGVSSVLGLPVWLRIGRVEPVAWLFVLASGLIEALYFTALARAYSLGDLSQVYPIARGSAQPLTVVWGFVFLGERPTPLGLLGVLVIVAGLYLVNLPSWSEWRRPVQAFRLPAARWALLTGALISAYSAVDKQGVAHFDPVVYLYLILFVGWIALTPQWLSSRRRAALLDEIRPGAAGPRWYLVAPWPDGRRAARAMRIVAAGLLGVGAYLLVLEALRLSPVSYVGPAREVSVVIGSWIGVRFLHERGGALRVAASALVAAGVLLIALGG